MVSAIRPRLGFGLGPQNGWMDFRSALPLAAHYAGNDLRGAEFLLFFIFCHLRRRAEREWQEEGKGAPGMAKGLLFPNGCARESE